MVRWARGRFVDEARVSREIVLNSDPYSAKFLCYCVNVLLLVLLYVRTDTRFRRLGSMTILGEGSFLGRWVLWNDLLVRRT